MTRRRALWRYVEPVGRALARARELVAAGRPVLVNVWLDRTDFRERSLSI